MIMRLFPVKVFFCLLFGIGIVSCSMGPLNQLDEEGSDTSEQACTSSDRVVMTDVYEFLSVSTKGDLNRITVEPVIDSEEDTLMYLVNYDNGWKVLSSDKRTPAVIAERAEAYKGV